LLGGNWSRKACIFAAHQAQLFYISRARTRSTSWAAFGALLYVSFRKSDQKNISLSTAAEDRFLLLAFHGRPVDFLAGASLLGKMIRISGGKNSTIQEFGDVSTTRAIALGAIPDTSAAKALLARHARHAEVARLVTER